MSEMNDVLRTPDECFSSLPGFAFEPHYLSELQGYEGLRMHYVDEGSRRSESVLVCCHGQPTWSYLFRRVITNFVAAGRRVIAPDLFGFGRSDKPADERVHTFEFHRGALKMFLETLDLRQVTLVVHDFGGYLGLTLPMEMPDRIVGLLIMNTFLGTGDVLLGRGFQDWRAWSNSRPDMNIGRLMGRACPHLTAGEAAAYDAPFPEARYKAGVRSLPNIVPDSVDAPGAAISRDARNWLSQSWHGESLMVIGMRDPVVRPSHMRLLGTWVNGLKNYVELPEAGHFVPEWGEVMDIPSSQRSHRKP
jgi:haloalkane dehalogenase